MKITLDGKSVDAVNEPGSQIWTLANGAIVLLQQDYSTFLTFKTINVLKDVVQAVEAEVKVAEVAVQNVIAEVSPKVEAFVEKVEANVEAMANVIVQDVRAIENKVDAVANAVVQRVEEIIDLKKE